MFWQARIAEEIQQKNIQENFEAAIENTPEVFGHINMLYVDMKVGLNQEALATQWLSWPGCQLHVLGKELLIASLAGRPASIVARTLTCLPATGLQILACSWTKSNSFADS